MFGYIKVDRANLLGKEFDAYRAVYCSLCKQLGRDYSLLARFILSYDGTFYAVLGLNLASDTPCYTRGRCRFNPLKPCHYIKNEEKIMSLAAALTVSSAYYKLKDNLHDLPWFRRIGYRLIQPLVALWRRKAKRRYPDIDRALANMLSAQWLAEANPDCVLDEAAEPTAHMLSEVCGILVRNIDLHPRYQPDNTLRIIQSIAYFLGRWIYLIDAADDYEKDQRLGGFNPYFLTNKNEAPCKEAILPSLNHALSEALLAYGLLEKGRFDPVISNVLCISCVNIQSQILNKFDHKHHKLEK